MDYSAHLAWSTVSAVTLAMQLWTSGHAILYKRDARSAVTWVGFIWLVPFLGALFYLLLGINRLHRQARSLRSKTFSRPEKRQRSGVPIPTPNPLDENCPQLLDLAFLSETVTDRAILDGNEITVLRDGDAAYPVMLEAIEKAHSTVSLSTYIFDNDAAGKKFADALKRAADRGVQVRVLIDDVGARYSWPSIMGVLRSQGIPHAKFLPRLMPRSIWYANLRSHRKILVVDGRIGFTGGMNIRQGYIAAPDDVGRIRDLHFRLRGPAVAQLQDVFVEDWKFAAGEMLSGADWFPSQSPAGSVFARVIEDGPDDAYDRLRLVILGALALARQSVRILTPYFLPDAALVTALNVAALRGVEVDIVIPEKNNLRLVQWACSAQLWQVLEHGCRVWLNPPPFDHSKAMVVDDHWSLIGSANWDPRSLRLNFEMNVECYDRELAATVTKLIDDKIAVSRQTSLAEVDGRPIPVRLRDGLARLFTPFL